MPPREKWSHSERFVLFDIDSQGNPLNKLNTFLPCDNKTCEALSDTKSINNDYDIGYAYGFSSNI